MRRARVRPGESVAGLGRPVLAAVPVSGASHYQLHSGLYGDAFEAERASFPSAARRLFFRPALRANAFRSALLRAEERLLASPGEARLMVFSEALRRRLISEHGVDAERITLDRPGIDRAIFRPAAAPSGGGPLRLLFIAHNFELKGLRTLLSALAPGSFDGSLTVAGNGPAARFRRIAARLGVAGRVRFAGALGREALADLYRAHDALVHPTFYDPFPLVVVEALASGLPVVTTRRCGAAEIVGEAGIVIDDPRDAAALASALRRLGDPETRRKMGAEAVRVSAPLSQRAHFGRVRGWLGLG